MSGGLKMHNQRLHIYPIIVCQPPPTPHFLYRYSPESTLCPFIISWLSTQSTPPLPQYTRRVKNCYIGMCSVRYSSDSQIKMIHGLIAIYMAQSILLKLDCEGCPKGIIFCRQLLERWDIMHKDLKSCVDKLDASETNMKLLEYKDSHIHIWQWFCRLMLTVYMSSPSYKSYKVACLSFHCIFYMVSLGANT